MNENTVQQSDAPVAAPAVDLSLGDYRATREAKPAKDTSKPPTPSTPEAPGSDAPNAAEELEADGTPEQQTERKKKLGGFQKTISKQSEEIAELKRRLGEEPPAAPAPAVAGEPRAAAPAAVPEPVYEVAKPKLEDCDGIEDFTEKLSDWKDAERTWRKEQKATLATRQAEANTLVDRWNTSKSAFKEENADYDDVIDAVKDIKLSPQHQRIFLDSEHGVALAYELAQDRDELKRIAGLSPVNAAKAIGRLEVKYSEQAAAPEPEIKVSSAPRPIKPVGGNATRPTPNAATMSPADYRKARESGRLT